MSTNWLVCVDAHPLLYRSWHQESYKGLTTEHGAPSGAFYGFLRSYVALRQRFPDAYWLFAFDSGKCWRNKIVKDYKHYDTKQPHSDFTRQLTDVKHFLKAVGTPTLEQEGLEADDLLSVMASRWLGYWSEHKAAIVSSDRDFFQLVSDRLLFYDDRQKAYFGPVQVLETTGVPPEHHLAYKCLLGDTADNLPGVIGYGKVKAAKFAALASEHSLELPKDQIAVFVRNKTLMRLPRRVEECSIPPLAKTKLENRVVGLIQLWTGASKAHYPCDAELAAALLRAYNCTSLHLADFVAYSGGDMPHVRAQPRSPFVHPPAT